MANSLCYTADMDMTKKTANEYIAKLAPAERAEFERIQEVVINLAPTAELVMSYGLPTFKLNGKVLLHFGAFKDHLSLFPGTLPIAGLQVKLKDFKRAKGTIQFTTGHAIPDDVLHDLVLLCVERAQG